MLNSHQPAFRPPTTPNSKPKTHKFPATLSAVQFWRGIGCVVPSPCACGSSQRPLIRVSFAPNNAHSSLVCRGSRRYLARLLATTSAPHGNRGFAFHLHSSRHAAHFAPLSGSFKPTIAQSPQHPYSLRSPPPKPPFIHPIKSGPIKQFAFLIWLSLPIFNLSSLIFHPFIFSYFLPFNFLPYPSSNFVNSTNPSRHPYPIRKVGRPVLHLSSSSPTGFSQNLHPMPSPTRAGVVFWKKNLTSARGYLLLVAIG